MIKNKKIVIFGIVCMFVLTTMTPILNSTAKDTTTSSEELDNSKIINSLDSLDENIIDELLEKQEKASLTNCLTSEELPILKSSLSTIENPDKIKTVQYIISEIENDGQVSEEQVAQYLEMENIEYEYMGLMTYLEAYSDGSAIALPSFPIWVPFATNILWLSMGGLLSWNAKYTHGKVDVTVGDTTYTNDHSGTAIGFYGFWSSYYPEPLNKPDWCVFTFVGTALIVII